MKGTLDGENISGRYLLFEAMLMQFMGPNLHLTPSKLLDDGFDVVKVHDRDREKLHEQLAIWQEGALWPSEFKTRQGEHLEIEWKGFPVHIDAKVWPGDREKPKPPSAVELTIEPKALESRRAGLLPGRHACNEMQSLLSACETSPPRAGSTRGTPCNSTVTLPEQRRLSIPFREDGRSAATTGARR